MSYNEILKKVNPIYFSAKGCLGLLAETGDSDIVKFYSSLDKEKLTAFDADLIVQSRVLSLEARYHVWNEIAKETDCQTIVDLPCGYLPHCLVAARLKKKYFGFDLPIVIDELSQIASQHLSENEISFVQFHGVDATNFSSMRNALKDVHGKICIITDGLLGYFNRRDLKIVFENIHRLLREFGGCWYVSDSQFEELMGITYATLTGNDKTEMLNATNRDNAKVAETDNSKCIFLNGTVEERRRFVAECNFSMKSFRYPDKLKFIPSLKNNPDLMNRLLAAYAEIEEWVLTADANAVENHEMDLPFTQKFSVAGDTLSIHLRGRLDTITAPKLLQEYEEKRATKNFTEIQIDAAELRYISYAGLRVFKIMRDDLANENSFKIINASSEVEKILLDAKS